MPFFRRVAAVVTVVLLLGSPTAALAWRSDLYPADWHPGLTDGEGRFLHDFSYAGYHDGELDPPASVPGPIVDATLAPYGADSTGAADATSAIQQAIDDVGAAGGGVVYLPAGTFRVAPPAGAVAALHIGHSGVVLRGAGAGATFLYNSAPQMREKRVVLVRPDAAAHASWYWAPSDARPLAQDAAAGDLIVHVEEASGYAPGDWIVVRADPTAELIADYDMTGEWNPDYLGGLVFYRQVVTVDVTTGAIELDVPLRHGLLLRDGARINRTLPHLEEIGVESLSIGMRQSDAGGLGTNDYQVPGTAGYDAHNAFAIYFNHVVNGWVRDVATYRPAANASDVHLLSNGIRMDAARNITVRDVDFRRPQYLGAGGNGYMIVLSGQECLVERAVTARGRHNFSFSLMQSSGNVVFDSAASDGKLPVDFHMHLSMANLIDNLTLDHDFIEARHRSCCGHGHGTTQSVFWNTEGLAYPSDQFLVQFIVHSVQFGHGYVIGTRGPADAAQTFDLDDPATPVDWVEGQGQGDTLEPASLWLDQRERRLGIGGGGGGGGDATTGAGGAASGPAGSGAGGAGIGGSSASGAGGDARADGPDADVACGCSAPGTPTSPAWPWSLLALFIARPRRRLDAST